MNGTHARTRSDRVAFTDYIAHARSITAHRPFLLVPPTATVFFFGRLFLTGVVFLTALFFGDAFLFFFGGEVLRVRATLAPRLFVRLTDAILAEQFTQPFSEEESSYDGLALRSPQRDVVSINRCPRTVKMRGNDRRQPYSTPRRSSAPRSPTSRVSFFIIIFINPTWRANRRRYSSRSTRRLLRY